MSMSRWRFRQWWYDEGPITAIVLAILDPAYAACCRKLWRKLGRHPRDVQPQQIVPLKYGAEMSRVIGLVRRVRDDGTRSAVTEM